MLIPVIAAVVVLGGAAAFYFGYYSNPSVIYSQSLGNTGKGYDKLVDFADKQSKLAAKGYTGSGSYNFKTSGFSTDGHVGYKGNGSNADLTFDLGVAGTRINTDFRVIKPGNSATPDIYFKVGGIKGLGTLVGEPSLDQYLNQLDGTWIVIDHTLYQQLATQSDAQALLTSPTHDQLIDEARAFGRVNQQYLFSTDKDKAVTKVVQKVGRETVGGHKTYHYKVVLQKANVKKYILAQRDALKASKLNDWLKANKLDKDAYDSLTKTADSANDINTSDTYDVWMDTGNRVVYKVRFSGKDNPAANYADVGLDYKGGDNFPFFVTGISDADGVKTNYDVGATIDTKTGKMDFKLDVKDSGSDSDTLTADFDTKPSSSTITVDKPANAKSITEILSELGLSSDSAATSTDSSDAGSAAAGAIQLQDVLGGRPKSGSAGSTAVQNLLLRRLLTL